MLTRRPLHRYRDPVDRIWLACARQVGFSVVRADDCYASSDGAGRITIGQRETLDGDDSLAQMIFHELCHALVEGPDAIARPDWGLDNETERDVPREEACLRLQAFLADRHGLRRLLAPTTPFRDFYDALPADPFEPASDRLLLAARAGAARATHGSWSRPLDQALVATATIARAMTPFAPALDEGQISLWSLFDEHPPSHPTGLPGARSGTAAAANRCEGCAWIVTGRGRARCRQAERRRIDPSWTACERFEPATLDCQQCGACCREAYDAVLLSPRDPVLRAHPTLVVLRGGQRELRREGDRCAALAGGSSSVEPYACTIYDERPRPCREFTRGGVHCLTARRRVGQSL